MSTWIADKPHIDVLVNALRRYGVVSETANLNVVGSVLWHANHRSYNYDYGDDEPTPVYRARVLGFAFDPVKLHKAVRFLVYNSCIPEGVWERSEAARWMGLLDALVIADMSAEDQRLKAARDAAYSRSQPGQVIPQWPALDAAPWGLTRCRDVA